MVSDRAAGWAARIWAWIGGGLVTLVGLPLLLGGGYLVFRGGSPYYLLAGAAVTATGVMAVRRHPAAGLVYAATLAATLGWALWEAGFAFWPLLPRLFAPAVLGLFLLLVIPTAPRGARRNQSGAAVALTSLVARMVLPPISCQRSTSREAMRCPRSASSSTGMCLATDIGIS